ncbi:nuclear transport factor 2 [Pseudovirgaria hyperparasitica]|uniref:Nuclear transport factor 2 n=1 Tax=Pseudovirgaria hyperparasitica TaxID=470096 RepID=A0A6A6WF57_9PEZI|nr:nuclear transport factor 2 [Pseudovirgaria hyperparasitica]KAF2761458.1 nuclear transport factor 2 [Pseudovirgaria hyperparasitica]
MADFQGIAQQFVEFYYKTFDENRASLQSLYREQSMLTFESAPSQGAVAITEKLVGLPFQKVQHKVNTLDAQPTSEDGGIMVMVTGQLLVDEEQNVMNFCQTFQLKRDGGSYFVFNDVFRLVYG